MPNTIAPPIPDRLFASIYALILYSPEHVDRPEQAAAKARLHDVLVSREALAVYALPEALRDHSRAFGRNCFGEWIVGECWARDRARLLAGQVEMHIQSTTQRRVARSVSGRVAA